MPEKDHLSTKCPRPPTQIYYVNSVLDLEDENYNFISTFRCFEHEKNCGQDWPIRELE